MKEKSIDTDKCQDKGAVSEEVKIVTFRLSKSDREDYQRLADLRGETFTDLVKEALKNAYSKKIELMKKLSA